MSTQKLNGRCGIGNISDNRPRKRVLNKNSDGFPLFSHSFSHPLVETNTILQYSRSCVGCRFSIASRLHWRWSLPVSRQHEHHITYLNWFDLTNRPDSFGHVGKTCYNRTESDSRSLVVPSGMRLWPSVTDWHTQLSLTCLLVFTRSNLV